MREGDRRGCSEEERGGKRCISGRHRERERVKVRERGKCREESAGLRGGRGGSEWNQQLWVLKGKRVKWSIRDK